MTQTASSPAKTTILHPYIYFYGQCEAALAFYGRVFGGRSEIMFNRDTPFAAELPPDTLGRVMHASFTGPGVAFFASDGREVKAIDSEEGNISLSLSFTDAARGEAVLAALSEGGTIKMPLDNAFWGGRFASVIDKFGIEWMMVLP